MLLHNNASKLSHINNYKPSGNNGTLKWTPNVSSCCGLKRDLSRSRLSFIELIHRGLKTQSTQSSLPTTNCQICEKILDPMTQLTEWIPSSLAKMKLFESIHNITNVRVMTPPFYFYSSRSSSSHSVLLFPLAVVTTRQRWIWNHTELQSGAGGASYSPTPRLPSQPHAGCLFELLMAQLS